jgi:hypothetical protein
MATERDIAGYFHALREAIERMADSAPAEKSEREDFKVAASAVLGIVKGAAIDLHRIAEALSAPR